MALTIIDLVDDAIVSDPNAPEIAGAAELLAAGRARVVREGLDSRKGALEDGIWKALQLLSGGADEYLGTPLQSTSAHEAGTD
jgi:hypothetical protein